MSLKIFKKIKHNGVTFTQGHFYEFKYNAYENDPRPMVVFINAIKGKHPNTGHEHRYIQCINLNYIPRKDRKTFIKLWEKQLEKGAKPEFTWQIVKQRYPYISFAIRRYFLKPTYYIRDPREIDINNLDKEIIRSWHKDFSKMLKRKIASKLKGLFVGKRK